MISPGRATFRRPPARRKRTGRISGNCGRSPRGNSRMGNTPETSAPGLRSGALSGRALYAATGGIIVATGSLALNGVGMGTAGPAFILALLVAYGLALINSTVFSELGTTYPKAGSILVYVSKAFGKSLGTAAALSYAIGLVLACSAECTVIGRLLAHTIPGLPWWGR